jgi:hypothetical protein
MATISTAEITEATATDNRHHANADKSDFNMHLPKGYRTASAGSNLMVGETGDEIWEQAGLLPPADDYAVSSASAPTSVLADIYLLDDSTAVLTITSIAWQSGTTVRITFSGTPNLSSYSTVNNVAYIYGAVTNSEHLGRFVMTTINDGSDYIEVTNAKITDATKDETGLSNSAELPHSDWNGASNGDWVRHDGTEYFRISPVVGAKCYDKTLLQTRTWNGTRWLGDFIVQPIAFSDELTVLNTGTAKATYRSICKMYISEVRVSLTTAGTTSGLTTIDVNDGGTTILSTKITIDLTKKTSKTATTPAVISDAIIADDAEITIDIDAISTGSTESGGKVYLIGNCI